MRVTSWLERHQILIDGLTGFLVVAGCLGFLWLVLSW
jgi:hypothetical protein